MFHFDQMRTRDGLLRRRDFLALSSVAGGAALLPGLAGAAEGLAPVEGFSVGYLEGSDRFDDVFHLPWRDLALKDREEGLVVPADSLLVGDSTMAFSFIQIKLHGLYPAMPPSRFYSTLSSVCFTMHYHLPWLGLERPLPFFAWGARFGSRPTSGSPTRFIVPTREDGSLAMSMDLVPAPKTGKAPSRADTDFTVDSWTGRPKLQRGIYFLGFDSSTFKSDQVIPDDPTVFRWDLCSLVMSVEKLEEGDI